MTAVTLELFKEHLNLTDTTPVNEPLLQQYLAAAEDWVSIMAGVVLSPESPASLKQAVLMLAASFEANREDVLVGVSAESIPHDVHALIAPHRSWSF